VLWNLHIQMHEEFKTGTKSNASAKLARPIQKLRSPNFPRVPLLNRAGKLTLYDTVRRGCDQVTRSALSSDEMNSNEMR